MNFFRIRKSDRFVAPIILSSIVAAIALTPSVTFAQAPAPPTPVPNPAPPTPNPTPNPFPNPAPNPNPQAPGNPQAAFAAARAAQAAAAAQKPKPYAEVITKEAKTSDGLIKTHIIGDKLYFEIPKSLLTKELLWVTTFGRTQVGYGYGGTEVNQNVIRFEKRDDRILLRGVDYQLRTQTKGSTERSIELANLEPIIYSFPVAAYGPNDSAVIDAAPLVTADITEFSPKKSLGAIRLDPNRTFVNRAKSFPQNVELDILATYVGGANPQGRFNPQDGPSRDSSSDTISAIVHHSIVTLPATPMKARLYDSRVGWFRTQYYDFGSDEKRVKPIAYINRWRLEKKDPTAALSEPVKPIVYYVGPEVPEKWREAIKKGIEDWQPAFEKAGFKNAIIAKDAPTKEQDPDFDADDIRYSVIRWLPSTVENAYGPSVVDPRTGEILNANIKVFHNVLKLSETWYFVQASPNDKRGQKLPLPDDLTASLLRYVVSHEVGHTLGLPHNYRGSSTFSIAQLRSAKWTNLWGDESSIMDYGRFNYVAQPGDGARLIPKQGPYDLFAIEWGYKPLPGSTPESEKSALDAIAARQATNPQLRFGSGRETGPVTGDDPTQRAEDLGDDPIEATRLGLKNINRVMGYIVPATTKYGEDYEMLSEMYTQLVAQRTRELSNVVALVGSATETNWHAGRGSSVWTPVDAGKQKQAVQFLIENAFQTPTVLLKPEVLDKIEPSGSGERVLRSQVGLLNLLLSDARTTRMVDIERLYKGKTTVYPLSDFMEDVRRGMWSELGDQKIAIDSYRRNLQRAYIGALAAKLNGGQSEVRPLSRIALSDTLSAVQSVLKGNRIADRSTKAHLMDVAATIEETLKPGANVNLNLSLGLPGLGGRPGAEQDDSKPLDLFDF